MFISLGRDLWVRLSSQPTLQSLTGARLIQKLRSSGLCPRLQHSWRAERGRARRDRGGISIRACELVRSAVVSRLIASSSVSVWRGGGQSEHSSRPHNGAAPQGPSGVCGDVSRVKLISKAWGPMCLPHQAGNRVESINKMKGIKEQVGLSCVQWPSGNDTPCLPTCTLPAFISHPNGGRGRWFADKIPTVPVAGFFSRHNYLPQAAIPPSVGQMWIASISELLSFYPPSTGCWFLTSGLSENQPQA